MLYSFVREGSGISLIMACSHPWSISLESMESDPELKPGYFVVH